LPRRHRRVGKYSIQDLSLQWPQELRHHESRGVHVRAGHRACWYASGKKRKASIRLSLSNHHTRHKWQIACQTYEQLGPISSGLPGVHTGNLDNKDLIAGTMLYMPLHVAGALFSVGDSHAAQGHGEVDITAIETGLRGKFQFIVRNDMKLLWPRAETPTHWVVMGLNPDLDDAMKIAVRETIDLITKRFPDLTREEAYMIASVAVDYHVTQAADGTKGIHGMIPKAIFQAQ
jgi:acetamidase/formamidase